MLPFFTNPYPDELLYSAIARYHFYSGNLDCKDTLEELFGNRSVIPSVEIGSHFSILSKKLGSHYSIETLLANHTIYPYYVMFLSKYRQQEIIQDVANEGQALYTRLGIVAGSICRKESLYYCTSCAQDDVEQYGEPYIHREHQLQGIDYCPHHEMPLKKYPVTPNSASRIEFIRFEMEQMDLSHIYEVDPYGEIKIRLAKQAYMLLQQPLHLLSRQEVSLKYRGLLRDLKLVTSSNHIRQKELNEKFKQRLPIDFLAQYESVVDVVDEYNWLKVLTRNMKRHVHPFRHLLMLYFLEQDIDDFIDLKTDIGPFGEGPFPCLNRTALHYQKQVIPSVEITRDFKTNASIGTFKCTCGFVYARKGPDNSPEDRFRIGRVKQFGFVWQEKLKQLAEGDLSIRAIARELGVDSKTVKRYLSNGVEVSKEVSEPGQGLMAKYKQDIVEIIQEFPQLSRTSLREKCKKQYIFLYRHDKEWLMDVLPSCQKKQRPTKIVDWSKRDQEYVVKIKRLCKELLELEKPIRITLSFIGRRLGILANLERHTDKLPKTKRLLSEITESVQQFQIRRCCIVIDRMIMKDEPVILWKVQRMAAVKSHHFYEIKSYLQNYVQQKQDVKNDEQTTS
ncbi:TnsD family transposase [Priestia flexa]|uniref:TnsD family transposase n=1 Tax=Priestia flexa TaxID=86664 RepID=UPI002E1B4E5C|nr:TnsD family transposase [Priestia flexa]MED3825867.1 TnsD family transposase [Priestia flexa]MED3826194.1 TnsD family transposase [Priestia flexa]